MQPNEANSIDKFIQAFYSLKEAAPIKPDSLNVIQQPNAQALKPQLLEALSQIPSEAFKTIAIGLSKKILAIETTPPTAGSSQPIPADLPDELLIALKKVGISKFHSHQVEALACLREGRDLTLATPTASGKTLCYLPAILECCLSNPNTTALMLFPLKALANDQMKKLSTLVNALSRAKSIKVGLLTGDTPSLERHRLFTPSPPRILGTNPDILHFKLYATCKSDEEPWRTYLRNLRWVVVDEMHSYLGSFGSHFANLMRRLRVAVDSVGGDSSRIQYIFSTATIGNPAEVSLRFTGRESTPEHLVLIDKSGAGRKGRTLVSLQPSKNANYDASLIAVELMQQGLKSLIFTPTKVGAKNLLVSIQENLRTRQLGNLTSQVAVFYGSLKSDRRYDIIQQLQEGSVKTIVSTNALEAGIDISEIDCVLVRGWPGSIMSFFQEIGRCGRNRPGLAIFLPVAQNALDSFYGSNPHLLLSSPAESAIFNENYPVTLAQHLHCSTREAGVPQEQLTHYFGESAQVIADSLRASEQIWLNQSRILKSNGYPHKTVSLRGNSNRTIELIDKNTGEKFEEMDLSMAYREVHVDAIYTAQSPNGNIAKYRSENLNLEERTCILSPISAESKFFTTPETDLEISLLSQLAEPVILPTSIEQGRIRLTHYWGQINSKVTGFKLLTKVYEHTCINPQCSRHHQYPVSGQNCRFCKEPIRQAEITKMMGETTFPESLTTQFSAPVIKIEINSNLAEALRNYVNQLKEQVQKHSTIPNQYTALWESAPTAIALHSIAHQIILATPLVVLSSSLDIDFIVAKEENHNVGFFFETSHGGSGATDAIFTRFTEFAASAKHLAENCSCQGGCPRCLTIFRCPQQNRELNKEVGLFLLLTLLSKPTVIDLKR